MIHRTTGWSTLWTLQATSRRGKQCCVLASHATRETGLNFETVVFCLAKLTCYGAADHNSIRNNSNADDPCSTARAPLFFMRWIPRS